MAVNGEDQVFHEELMIYKPPPLKLAVTTVPIDQIELDTNNPRLRYKKLLNPDKSLTDILFMEEDTKHLKISIETNGLIERPYVRRASTGIYIVIEGNRRTSCWKKSAAENPSEERWKHMPVKILPPETTDQQEAVLMGEFHISGRIKWDAHERAGHVYRMAKELMIPIDTLKSIFHMGQPAIEKMIRAYEMMFDRYAKIDGGKYAGTAEGKYSFFAEFVSNGPFNKSKKSGDPFFIEDFCRWVGEGRIPRAEDVRALPQILERSESRNVFLTEAPEEAFKKAKDRVERNDPTKKSDFFKVLKQMVAAGKAANLTDIEMAAKMVEAQEMMSEAKTVLDRLHKQAQAII